MTGQDDNELPGMWSSSDFTGGRPDVTRGPDFDPDCHLCDTDWHVCPGCGVSVPHGTVACEACRDL